MGFCYIGELPKWSGTAGEYIARLLLETSVFYFNRESVTRINKAEVPIKVQRAKLSLKTYEN